MQAYPFPGERDSQRRGPGVVDSPSRPTATFTSSVYATRATVSFEPGTLNGPDTLDVRGQGVPVGLVTVPEARP